MIYLASCSPRRADILNKHAISFKVISPNIPDEAIHWDPSQSVERNAQSLAEKKSQSTHLSTHWILACDTMVFTKKRVFGKPKNNQEAISYIKVLSRTVHYVVTGYAFYHVNKPLVSGYEVTTVQFNPVSDNEIQAYVNGHHVCDKAGGYGIQDIPKSFIKSIHGSIDNVIGLPSEIVIPIIQKL